MFIRKKKRKGIDRESISERIAMLNPDDCMSPLRYLNPYRKATFREWLIGLTKFRWITIVNETVTDCHAKKKECK